MKLKAIFSTLLGERKNLSTGELYSTSELQNAGLNMYERPDPMPLAPPIGYKRELSMVERLRDMMFAAKVEKLRAEMDAETPEEAEDFDVGEDDDDYSPASPFEYDRHDLDVLQAYENLQNHRLAMDAKYGTTTADANVDAAAAKAAKPKTEGEGAKPPAEDA